MAEYITELDLIEKQALSEKAMLEEFRAGSYTLENPLVKLNPYLVSPLAAVVLFRTEEETAVTVTVFGKEPEGAMRHTFPKAKEHILPVLGLYPDYDNTVELRLYQGGTKQITIRTEPAAAQVPELISMKTTASYLKDQLIIVSPAVSGALTGFDYNGDIRWYISVPMQMALKRLKNGHFLVGTHRLISNPYYTVGLYEFDAVGKIYREYQIPGGYHHDQVELENGDFLVLTEDLDTNTVEDQCALIDRETGDVKKIWNFKDFLTPGEGISGNYTEKDWFHNNAVAYDKKTNSLTLSGRHIDAIVNIDYDTGALNWILGDPETWPEEKKKYFFTPEGEGFEWQYEQHACVITPDGDVMCFDNGTFRSKLKENYVLNKDNFSRAVRYRINTEKMTIRQIWEFGRELGPDFFSQHISNVEYYSDGHYLIHSGGKQLYDGVPNEGLLPHTQDPRARREGLTFEIENGEVRLEMRIKGNYYRAKKFSLYHEGNNLDPEDGRKCGSLAVTRQTACELPSSTETDPLPEECLLHIIEDSDRITFKARYEKNSDVFVVLKGEETRSYRVDTSVSRYSMFAGSPYIQPDAKNTSMTVNKNGLNGAYAVFILVDGKEYDTQVTINK